MVQTLLAEKGTRDVENRSGALASVNGQVAAGIDEMEQGVVEGATADLRSQDGEASVEDPQLNSETEQEVIEGATADLVAPFVEAGSELPPALTLREPTLVSKSLRPPTAGIASGPTAAATELGRAETVFARVNEPAIEEEPHKPKQEVANVPSYSVAAHTKSRASNNPKDSQSSDLAPPIPLVHSKSFLRGSSSYTSIGTATSAVPLVMVSIHPTDDATVHSYKDTIFLGGAEVLIVGAQREPQSIWYNDILLKFDVASFPFDETHNYSDANRAVLRLLSLTSSPSGGVVQLASSGTWGEGDVTWLTAPKTSQDLATIGRVRPNSWVEVDVTDMLRHRSRRRDNDATVSLRITRELTNHSWLAKYSSKENEAGHHAPELRVYF